MIVQVATFVTIGVLSLVLFGACQGGPSISAVDSAAAESADQAVPVLHNLTGVDRFKAAFNEDEGLPRIILLLSPT